MEQQSKTMKNKAKTFIVFFPVLLVTCQVLANLLLFYDVAAYNKYGFYLNTFFGTNVMFAVFLVAFTFSFGFCDISRWAAVAELAFAVNYLIIKQDNLYNVMFQIIVGSLSILATVIHYSRRFPLYWFSLPVNFLKSVMKNKSCSKGMKHWESDMKAVMHKRFVDSHANQHDNIHRALNYKDES